MRWEKSDFRRNWRDWQGPDHAGLWASEKELGLHSKYNGKEFKLGNHLDRIFLKGHSGCPVKNTLESQENT